MVEAAVFCIETGLSVLCKDGLGEAVGLSTCTSVVAVFFLSSSQSEGKGEDKTKTNTDTQNIS